MFCFIVGADRQKLNVRHKWAWKFNTGEFEIAVRKAAIPVPAPQCRMEYLILRMPIYYPENPAQATTEARQAVYDALVSIKKAGKGGLKIHFDALWYSRQGPSGPELTTCKDAARILP